MTNGSWRRRLVERFPNLFVHRQGDQTSTPGYPAVGDGWRDLIEVAAERIDIAAAGGGFRIDQIKEKYGTLRLYVDRDVGVSPEAIAAVDEAVALAEARSACTCEQCGREGALYSAGIWLTTLCPDHAKGEPLPVRDGFDNVFVVRALIGGRLRIVSCRRYDRLEDRFVDVDPSSLGIEEE